MLFYNFRLCPKASIQRSILNSLTKVMNADLRRCFQIGYRASNLQNAVMRTRREVQLSHRHSEEFVALLIELAVSLEEAGRHSGVAAGGATLCKALLLDGAGC